MPPHLTSRIVAYENGELDDEGILDLFQELIDTQIVWQLQGHYGRMARRLIESGRINPPICRLPI